MIWLTSNYSANLKGILRLQKYHLYINNSPHVTVNLGKKNFVFCATLHSEWRIQKRRNVFTNSHTTGASSSLIYPVTCSLFPKYMCFLWGFCKDKVTWWVTLAIDLPRFISHWPHTLCDRMQCMIVNNCATSFWLTFTVHHHCPRGFCELSGLEISAVAKLFLRFILLTGDVTNVSIA